MKHLTIYLCFLFTINTALGQSNEHTHHLNRKIEFPDIDGYITLACDLHQHSVFSDGSVWPNIRVQEALKDGLDAISLTEHLEYQPHKDDIPHPDRNRSYHLALEEAKDKDLIIINGSEITRSMPPGHTNAIFIEDSNKLLMDDATAVFKEANNQGAFVFWNHPNWTSHAKDGMAKLSDLHKTFIKQNLLHGIEIANDDTYSTEALQIAIDNDLTLIGTSDIHGLIDWQYDVHKGGHRPITLVFAKERTRESIREALLNKQTVVYFNNLLIGREEFLKPLIKSSLTIKKAEYQKDTSVLMVSIENNSNTEFTLKNKSGYTFHKSSDLIHIEPKSTTTLFVKTLTKLEDIQLTFDVLNGITAPKTHLEITFKTSID